MDITVTLVSFLKDLGIDAAIVLSIVVFAQVIKWLFGSAMKRWIVAIPFGLGLVWGIALHGGDGLLAMIRGGFVYGAWAIAIYCLATKLLGVRFPGNSSPPAPESE